MKTKKVEINKSKQDRCRYCHPSIRNLGEHHCVVNGWEDDKVRAVTKEECENYIRIINKNLLHICLQTEAALSFRHNKIIFVLVMSVVAYVKLNHVVKNTMENHTSGFILATFQ